MKDIEKTIKYLESTKEEIGKHLDESFSWCAESIDNAIQTIRDLQGEKNIHDFEFDFSNCVSFNCQCGRHYINSGAKWHMVADGDMPNDDRDVLCIDISGDYFAGWCSDKDWTDGEFVDIDVIAWTELPIFKENE